MPPPPTRPAYFQTDILLSLASASKPTSSTTTKPPPKEHPSHPKPTLRIHLNDLSHPGTALFLTHLSTPTALSSAVTTVLSTLYSPHSSSIPPTRSVTLVLRPMSGVAYTTGLDLDPDHKEIHFNTSYIAGIAKERLKQEMTGVLVHEMVHCWQWNALGTAPGGLIEGIADWVRLRAKLSPPHWKKEVGGEWDAGYQHTGYFLEYLEERFGEGTVMAVNEGLKGRKYEEKEFWERVVGKGVKKLWKDYQTKLKKELELEVDDEEENNDEDRKEEGSSIEEQKKVAQAFVS